MRFGKRMATCVALVGSAVGLGAGRDAPTIVDAQRHSMGTMFVALARVPATGAAATPAAVRRALEAALDEVSRLDRVMSHYDANSELSRLVRSGAASPVEVSADLYDVLEHSLEMTRRSQGRFDVTVGTLVRTWREAGAQSRAPSDVELAAARACSGPASLTLVPPRRVYVHSSCLSLDLGGIAKGVAVDRALHVLKAHGITDAIVNAGGSTMAAIGTAEAGGQGWPVQAHGNEPVRLLRDAALSTSQASRELVDPASGSPVTTPLTVHVVMPGAAGADAWSTALLLSTIDEGRTMLRGEPSVSVTWIDKAGHVVAAHGRELPTAGQMGRTR